MARQSFGPAMVHALLALLAPSSALAQSVAGDVVDDLRSPVRSVAVALIDADGRMVAHDRSDGEGHFHVRAPAPGRYRLHVAATGYRSLSGGPYDLRDDVTLEVLVVIHPAPIPVEGIDVEVDARVPRLVSAGFYERRESGHGYFFEGEEIRRAGSVHVARFLGRLPRVRAGTRTALLSPSSIRNPTLHFERGTASCVPALWIDGSLLRPGGTLAEPLRPDDWVNPDEIAGIEFYPGPSSTPLAFNHSAACAVLVVWTRGAGRARRPPG